MSALTYVFAIAAALNAPIKVAVAPLSGGDGTTKGMVRTLGESFTAELRRNASLQVLAYAELEAILSHEQLSALMGCADDACYAHAGNATGADALATGTVGKVGKSWLLALKLIDLRAAKVVASADRRLAGADAEAMLDLMPSMVAELIEQSKSKSTPTASETATRAPVVGEAPPAAFKDTPYKDVSVARRLSWLADGHGYFVGYDPAEPYHGPVFAGDAKHLYAQRITGGGKSGRDSWSFVFWEPRVTERWRGGLEARDGKYVLQCGDKAIALERLSAPATKTLLAEAKLYDVRWQRQAVHLARDDRGNYYFVDQARGPEGNSDYRLFVGLKGQVAHLPLSDALIDNQSSLFVSAQGRLAITRHEADTKADWMIGDSKVALTLLDLYQQAPMIYTKLGAYRAQALGTPCDPYLGE